MTTRFKDLGIKTETTHFTGDKIKIQKVLNKEIKILNYTISPSKIKGNYVQMHVEVCGSKHVIFTGSTVLMQTLEKVPKDRFPFSSTIVQEGEHFEFT